MLIEKREDLNDVQLCACGCEVVREAQSTDRGDIIMEWCPRCAARRSEEVPQ
jgi:hypothetical protein